MAEEQTVGVTGAVFPAWANPTTEQGGPHFGDLVDRVRDVMDAARLVDPSDELARELIADLARVADRMEAVAVPSRQAPADSRIDLPARGNVALPPFTMLEESAEGVRAEATFRPFHQGEGAAHGGNVSLLFDELAGSAVMARLTEGFPRTAYLTVDYRALTPIGRPLMARVWVDRIDGRKLFVRGTLHDGEILCAEMDALFLEVAVPEQTPPGP